MPKPQPASAEKLAPKIYAVLAVTSMLTFGTLVTGYELLFYTPIIG